jgi:hypothetical protein
MWTEIPNGLAQVRQSVADTDYTYVVTEILERDQDIVLGPKRVDFDFCQAVDVIRRDQRFMHHKQYTLPLHRT